ncbi:unnamed protein product [Prorocentrum cordatum]|uniref:SMP-30/Gluconolactonase/LRE-like region domain-containing protein n=1 Tax=Prorocentrum cordatum TaxID=2364126 RepID=A0ABN9T4R8_9DINO|nr:unnamed protein product [Polarella glacialis]
MEGCELARGLGRYARRAPGPGRRRPSPAALLRARAPGPAPREFVAELCAPCGNRLGECPLWDDRRAELCWDGSYLFAFEDGFAFWDPGSPGVLERVGGVLEPGLPTRLNDGRVDMQGRFVAAGCVERGDEPLSGVYRVNTDLSVEKLRGSVRCGNSICFSAALGMAFADPALADDTGGTSVSTIWHFPEYESNGMTDPPSPFAVSGGRPDGSVIDSEGCLWNAEFGGGCVTRYRMDGTADMVVRVPASDLTDASVFANQRMSRKHREELPEGYAGGLFRARLPVAGQREAAALRFSGPASGREATVAPRACPSFVPSLPWCVPLRFPCQHSGCGPADGRAQCLAGPPMDGLLTPRFEWLLGTCGGCALDQLDRRTRGQNPEVQQQQVQLSTDLSHSQRPKPQLPLTRGDSLDITFTPRYLLGGLAESARSRTMTPRQQDIHEQLELPSLHTYPTPPTCGAEDRPADKQEGSPVRKRSSFTSPSSPSLHFLSSPSYPQLLLVFLLFSPSSPPIPLI